MDKVLSKGFFIHTGAVYVYDIGKEDDTLIASSGVGENAHKDPISQVLHCT